MNAQNFVKILPQLLRQQDISKTNGNLNTFKAEHLEYLIF